MPNRFWKELYGFRSPSRDLEVFDKARFKKLEDSAFEKRWRLYGYGSTSNYRLCDIFGDGEFKLKNLDEVEAKIKDLPEYKPNA